MGCSCRCLSEGSQQNRKKDREHDNPPTPPHLAYPPPPLLAVTVGVPLLRVHGRRRAHGVQEAPHAGLQGLGRGQTGEAHGDQGKLPLGHPLLRQVPALEQRDLAVILELGRAHKEVECFFCNARFCFVWLRFVVVGFCCGGRFPP